MGQTLSDGRILSVSEVDNIVDVSHPVDVPGMNLNGKSEPVVLRHVNILHRPVRR
jgi:hypothetical protein